MPNNIERDLFIVIWKTNQYLISWRVIRFHFTVCTLFLFYNSWAELWPTFFSFLQEHLVAFQVKGEKHPRGGEVYFDVKLPALTSFLSLSWFSGLCSLRPIWSAPRDSSYFSSTTAYQPRWVFWYLVATPWCCWTPPPSLQLSAKLFATSLAGSTRMGQWIDRLATSAAKKRLWTKPCYV